MDLESSKQVLGALVAGTVFKYATFVWMNRCKGKQYVGKVSRLFLYPLKAARELEVGEAAITRHGLSADGVTDRHWMITREEDGEFQNTKQIPEIILIRATIKDDTLCFDADGVESLLLPLYPAIEQECVKTVKVYGNPQEALDCGDKAAAWICKVLQRKGLRLNYCLPYPEGKRLSQTVADTLLPWKPTDVHEDDEVAFQYFAPYMVMCDSSLGVLNGRLNEPVRCINFRPNIMIEGTEPFDEDTWREAFIGNEAHLRYVDDCTRCITITLDPDTAIEDKNEQPLKELRRFRCREPYGRYKPAFGVYMAVENGGKIKVGDPVYVVKK